MGKFENKIALIGGGLGRIKKDKFTMGLSAYLAQNFVEEGAKVIVVDIEEEIAERCALELGENVEAMPCDLLAERTYETEEYINSQGKKKSNVIWKFNPALTMVNKIVEKYGKIDILVTNFDLMIKGRVENLDDEIYENLKSQNLMPVFHLVAAVREQMSKQTKTTGIFSKVVLVTSFVGKAGLSVGSLYAAFKGGIISLTKTLAKEFARFANVNGVACGPFADRRAQGPKNRIKAKYQGGSTELAKKDLTYEKVTPMISFLASDEAQAITGQIISVDGGLWLKLES